MYTALSKRLLFRDLKNTSVGDYEASISKFTDECAEAMACFATKPFTYPQLLDKTLGLLPSHKYKVYSRAYDCIRGIAKRPSGLLKSGFVPEDFHVTAFVKFQKEKTGAVPRCISGRNSVGVLVEKAHIAETEHRFYSAHPLFNYRYSIKELDAYAKGALVSQLFDSIHDCVAIGADFARFDSSVHYRWIQAFQDYIKRLYPNRLPEYDDFCKHQINNTINSRCGVRATCKGRVMSGDASTSYKNAWICALIVRIFQQEYSLTDDVFKYIADGDDTIFLCSPSKLSIVNQFRDFTSKFGMECKMEEPVYIKQHIELCQSRMIRCGIPSPTNPHGWCFTRNPNKVLSSSAISANFSNTYAACCAYVHNIGLATIATEKGTPVAQAFGEMLARVAPSKDNLNYKTIDYSDGLRFRLENNDLSHRQSVITSVARDDYYLAWGYSQDLQYYLESKLGSFRQADFSLGAKRLIDEQNSKRSSKRNAQRSSEVGQTTGQY